MALGRRAANKQTGHPSAAADGPLPGHAHKDPDLRNTLRTQGLDSAPVCDAVLPNSGPCVRHREGRAVTGHAPRPAGPEGGGCADARYRHRRALLTPARVISPSRCQQSPHDVNDPLTVPTTRVRIDNAPSNSHPGRQRASTPKGGARAKAERAADAIDVDTADHARCPGGTPAPGPDPRRTAPDRAPPLGGTHTRTPI